MAADRSPATSLPLQAYTGFCGYCGKVPSAALLRPAPAARLWNPPGGRPLSAHEVLGGLPRGSRIRSHGPPTVGSEVRRPAVGLPAVDLLSRPTGSDDNEFALEGGPTAAPGGPPSSAGAHRRPGAPPEGHFPSTGLGTWVPEKPSFPIINRKGGVCGTGVPCVCTFSTAVEDAVEKSAVSPAKSRAWGGEKAARSACNKRKSMDFPGFYASRSCGKWPSLRIEWLSLFGMLGSYPP